MARLSHDDIAATLAKTLPHEHGPKKKRKLVDQDRPFDPAVDRADPRFIEFTGHFPPLPRWATPEEHDAYDAEIFDKLTLVTRACSAIEEFFKGLIKEDLEKAGVDFKFEAADKDAIKADLIARAVQPDSSDTGAEGLQNILATFREYEAEMTKTTKDEAALEKALRALIWSRDKQKENAGRNPLHELPTFKDTVLAADEKRGVLSWLKSIVSGSHRAEVKQAKEALAHYDLEFKHVKETLTKIAGRETELQALMRTLERLQSIKGALIAEAERTGMVFARMQEAIAERVKELVVAGSSTTVSTEGPIEALVTVNKLEEAGGARGPRYTHKVAYDKPTLEAGVDMAVNDEIIEFLDGFTPDPDPKASRREIDNVFIKMSHIVSNDAGSMKVVADRLERAANLLPLSENLKKRILLEAVARLRRVHSRK
jgi:Skp family chaperone for outer membrane proteins